jgi:hypothetical protein
MLGALAAALVSTFEGATAAADDPQLLSVGPLDYGFLTLPSGRTFKYLSTGPVLGKGGKHLGLGVNYVAEATTLAQLKTDAAELLEYVRPQAEAGKEEGVVIIGHFGFEAGKGSRATYNLVHTRKPSGEWSPLAPDPKVALPVVPRWSSHQELKRDPAAEKDAAASAQAWLKLADAEAYGESWEAAAPLLEGFVSKAKWITLATAWSATSGRVESRTLASILSTRRISDAPEGSYVVLEFRSKFSTGATAFERVVTMLCEDRTWRVAGYFRSAAQR